MAGSQEAAVKNRTLIYLCSATVAECVNDIFVSRVSIRRQKPRLLTTNNDFLFLLYRFFADVLLTPLEATRIRLVSEREFATRRIRFHAYRKGT